MNAYLIQFDLNVLRMKLSHSLGCPLSIADVREYLESAGFVESQRGWLTSDLRPLMLAYLPPSRPLFG
ncbi:MAG: hypothetical protein ABIG44_03620 [Planctomycetota bacterium]